MILDSQKKWKIDLQKSYLVGDRKGDIDAAKSVGVSSIFIDHNYNENKPIDFVYKTDNFACLTVLSKKILVMESLILQIQMI